MAHFSPICGSSFRPPIVMVPRELSGWWPSCDALLLINRAPFYASSSFLLMELFEGWNRDDDDRRRYKTFVRDRALTKKWMAIRQKSQRKSYILGKGENTTHFFTPHASKEGFFLSSLVVFLTEVELVVLHLSCFSSSVVFLLS